MSGLVERAAFLKLVEQVVTMAKPNIQRLDLAVQPDGEYVIAVCANGAQYRICTEADSLIAMAHDVIDFLRFK